MHAAVAAWTFEYRHTCVGVKRSLNPGSPCINNVHHELLDVVELDHYVQDTMECCRFHCIDHYCWLLLRLSYFDTKLKLHNCWLNQCILYCHCDQTYLYQSPWSNITWLPMERILVYLNLFMVTRVEVWCYSDMHERSTLVRWVAAAAHRYQFCVYMWIALCVSM